MHLLKPLELILPSDDSVVREKAVAALKIVGLKITEEAIYTEYMPVIKRMRKGDLFSMRICACFLYAHIYSRLDAARREYTRKKFEKLAKDDTPMVRRGAAQSVAIMADFIEADFAKPYLLPSLKALLQDDNDSVKIQAVYSSIPVTKLLMDSALVKSEIIPPFRVAVDNKMASWRLRFSVAEIAAQLAQWLSKDVVDAEIVGLYESLLQDKEPEVKSEAILKLIELSKWCSPSTMTEKILPIINAMTVNDNSQHVRGSLAVSICEISKSVGRENAIKLIVPPVAQLLKDAATEVRIALMEHLSTLAEVIGNAEFDEHIIPALVALATDKIWRVKLALIQFIPQLALFLDKQLFKTKLEQVVLGFLSDGVYQIREEAINLMLTLKEEVFDYEWFESAIESKVKEFHEHEKFGQRIHTLFVVQKVFEKVTPLFLNEVLFKFVVKLAEDPVPNIKFNVSKTIELIYTKLNYANKEQAKEILNKMEQDQNDFDVKYYAEKALKTITN